MIVLRERQSTGFGAAILLSAIALTLAPAAVAGEPKVFYTDIVSGPNSGGENGNGAALSIFGEGFGASKGSSKVQIGSSEVAVYKYWSDSRISVQPGPGVSSGPISVVVDGATSNTDRSFTVRDGDIYFVSTSGNDETGEIGNIELPFRDPGSVYDREDFGAGDFLVFLPGNPVWGEADLHSDNKIIEMDKSGTPNSPITLYGYPAADGSWPVFDISAQVKMKAVGQAWSTSISDVVVANMFLDKGGPGSCVTGSGSVNLGSSVAEARRARLANIEVIGGGMTAPSSSIMEHSRTHDSKFFGIKIHDTCLYSDTKYHLLYFGNHGHSNNEIAYCELHDNGFDASGALQIYTDTPRLMNGDPGGPNLGEFFIHHNKFYNFNREAIIIGRHVDGPIHVYNNVIYNSGMDSTGLGAIRLTSQDNSLVANIYNNTFANIDGGSVVQFYKTSGDSPPTVTMRNNVFHTIDGGTPYTEPSTPSSHWSQNLVVSNNLWYNSGDAPSWSDESTRVNADPRFVGQSANNFRLQPDSPAIDHGIGVSMVAFDFDLNQRPMDGDNNGSALYDIGAFESDGTVGDPPDPPEVPPAPANLTVE